MEITIDTPSELPPVVFLIIYILFIVSYVFFFRGIYKLLTPRSSGAVSGFVDTPTVTPSGAILGVCEIQGKAAPMRYPSGGYAPEWIAPISGERCVYYHVKFQESGNQGGVVGLAEKDFSTGPFSIADEHGSVIFEPNGLVPIDFTPNDFSSNGYMANAIDAVFAEETVASNDEAAINRAKYYFNSYAASDITQQWISSDDGYYKWHPILSKWIPTRDVSPDLKSYFDRDDAEWIALPAADSSLANAGMPAWASEVNKTFRSFGISPKADFVTEYIVREGQPFYIHGTVSLSDSGTDLIVDPREQFSNKLVISKKDEGQIVKDLKRRSYVSAVPIICNALFFVFFAKLALNESFQTMLFLMGLAVVFAAISIFATNLINTYNRFVRLRQQVHLGRSSIDVSTSRRSVLIPHIVDVVSQSSSYEKELQQKLAELRNDGPASKIILAFFEEYA